MKPIIGSKSKTELQWYLWIFTAIKDYLTFEGSSLRLPCATTGWSKFKLSKILFWPHSCNNDHCHDFHILDNATKHCLANGSWTGPTNYLECLCMVCQLMSTVSLSMPFLSYSSLSLSLFFNFLLCHSHHCQIPGLVIIAVIVIIVKCVNSK